MKSIIETQNLILKPLVPSSLHQLFENNDKQKIVSVLGCDEEEYKRFEFMHINGMETYNQSLYFFLLLDKETQKPIGECGYHTWNTTHHRAELFYKLKEEKFKRKGLMTEALKEVLAFGFSTMKLHRISAMVAPWNRASIKLLEKYNFHQEGLCREDYWYRGKYEDSACYALLKKEWEANR